jgi:copper chaperone NosL
MKILPSPRILMILALLSLGAIFFFPLWQILLDAAQFPGGLQLHIWINKISGTDKYILQNINILNHYIGMKAIHPDSIPELKYFPLVVYVMLAFGAVTVLIDKAWGYLTWPIVLSMLGMLGIYDFYLWLYDYGHNLDPTAPIKLEGMTYQPPLLGAKDLLNFYVQSYPHWGALFLGLAIVIAVLAYIKKLHQNKTDAIVSLSENKETSVTHKYEEY